MEAPDPKPIKNDEWIKKKRSMMGFQKMKLAGKLGVGIGRKLQLTREQAAARKPTESLKDLGGGIYEVMKPIEFKAGEIIGVEFREVPKSDYPALGVKAKDPGKPMAPPREKVPVAGAEKPDKAEKKSGKNGKVREAETAPKDEPVTPDGKTIVDPTA